MAAVEGNTAKFADNESCPSDPVLPKSIPVLEVIVPKYWETFANNSLLIAVLYLN
jgi:hypothetical protein